MYETKIPCPAAGAVVNVSVLPLTVAPLAVVKLPLATVA